MSDYLNLEPDQLRRIAQQQKERAAEIREWGQVPTQWLKDFPRRYGTIAAPVHQALTSYYNQRHQKAEHLADTHDKTHDELIAAARALEDADDSGAGQIRRSAPSGRESSPEAPTRLSTLMPAGMNTVAPNGIHPGPSAPKPSTTVGRPLSQPVSAPAATAATHPQIGVSHAAPSSMQSAAATPPRVVSAPINNGAPPARVPPTKSTAEKDVRASGGGRATAKSVPANATAVASGRASAAKVPQPLQTGPFAAALHAPRGRQTLPSFVVGERRDDDLALARTLLAAVLAAVGDSAPGLEWAAAVLRSPIGRVVLLTSTEGRGWLPPGLFLPAEVVHPWRWDRVLGHRGRRAMVSFEGTSDPARTLAEFGLLADRRRKGQMSALVSSMAISDNLHFELGNEVATEGLVIAHEATVDLSSPVDGLRDRLAVAGSDELVQHAEGRQSDARSVCLELARTADQLQRTISTDRIEISAYRAARARIFRALDTGDPVPSDWLDQIGPRVGDTVTPHSGLVDVSHLRLGGVLSEPPDTAGMRHEIFEHRANELLLLAIYETGRQSSRDAYYAYGEITSHPMYPAGSKSDSEND